MSPTIDPSKLKVTELREELQARGLDTKGNKPVLVKRLKKALEEELNKELPDTSIADTSTEDLDSSRSEEPVKSENVEPESEQEPTAVSHSENADLSSSDKVEDSTTSIDNVESSDSNPNTEQQKESATELESGDPQEQTEVNKEKVETSSGNNDVEMKEESIEDKQKGEKRKRYEDSSEPPKKKVFKIIEDEPEIDSSKVLLSWYDSDLHLLVDKESFLSAKPIHEGLFGYAWAGVRATHGIRTGKVRYEVKLTEELTWEDFTNQRRERQEKAKERREKEKQKQENLSQKNESSEKKTESEEEKTNEVNETKAEVAEESKMETSEATETSQVDDKSKESSEDKKEESEELTNDENKESSVAKEETETQNGEKTESNEKCEESAKIAAEPTAPILTHIFRTGWSLEKTSLQLGEDVFSYGYESTGKFVSNKEFDDFSAPYKLGDVIGAYLNITDENVEMRFTLNGELQPEIKSIPRSELPEETFVLFPHVLSRNISFELNLGTKEEPWFASPEGLEDYAFLQAIEDKIQGPLRPEKREECEVIMMCGLPGAGKTHWVKEYLKTNSDRLTNVIGSTHLLEKMTVHGQPLKTTYNGHWNILMEKLQRCLNRLGDIAAQRRRNYILDQTNVFPSAQHRKLRAFEGFKRRAVVVVVDDEEFAKRQTLKEAAIGKDVQDYVVMEMKANMALPTQGDLFDEVIYSDLNEEEAKAKVSQYNTEGKAAVNQKKKFHKDDKVRYYNRGPYSRGSNFRDNRGPQRFDRGPRGWGQLPPPGRHPRDRRPPPPHGPASRDWMRNNRGPPRPVNDRVPRDGRQMNYNRNRNPGASGRPNNWQTGGNGYGQGGWSGQQQGNWGNQGWGGYQQQGNWNSNGQSNWKYGNSNQGYSQQGYGQNWNDYYGQYSQNWSGQGQQSIGGSNQYAQWAEYAQQYAQGQNAKYTNSTPNK